MTTLDIDALPERLADVTRFVRACCGAHDTLDLIVEELFLNVAFHACPGEPMQWACSRSGPGGALIELRYPGSPFDPRADAPKPDLDAPLATRPIGGLGLHLVRELAESIDYRHAAGFNTLTVLVRMGS